MKENKTRDTRATTAEPVDQDTNATPGEGVPIKPKHYRKVAREEIEKTYKTIVATLAEEATKGSVRHTKLLFDLGGVQEEVQSTASRRRRPPSLGRLLLKEAEAMRREKEQAASDSNEAK
jgi:hypothetical protein